MVKGGQTLFRYPYTASARAPPRRHGAGPGGYFAPHFFLALSHTLW
jgi:hypothetical protein